MLFSPEFLEVSATVAVTAIACALLGPFLLLRRLALLTDAIGHVLLFGIVVAFLIVGQLDSPWLLFGAAATGLVTVVLIEALSRSQVVREDAAIGLTFPALFAGGIILATLFARNTHLDIDQVMLGYAEFAPEHRLEIGEYDLGPRSLIVMGLMGLLNLTAIAIFFKELKISTFDATLAASLGFLPAVLHYGLMTLVSFTVVTAFDSTGPVLVVAFFVIPAMSSYLLTDRLGWFLAWSVLYAVAGSFLGTAAAFALETTVSGTVATVMGGLFGLTWLAAPRYGLIRHWTERRRLRRAMHDRLLLIHLKNHEGTPEESAESDVRNLHEHFRWTLAATDRIVRRAMSHAWVLCESSHLKLTPVGREIADRDITAGPFIS
ncbi:metal ABC transporter permease [Zavarzinella formosa]|uniref:metal ABC transporter permease n=1 Tax=Zavarzinella formosa TaxID=360055 RepID=UPI0002D6FA18|nr:metal ABC transporter permease [Zavarzinella formosa]